MFSSPHLTSLAYFNILLYHPHDITAQLLNIVDVEETRRLMLKKNHANIHTLFDGINQKFVPKPISDILIVHPETDLCIT